MSPTIACRSIGSMVPVLATVAVAVETSWAAVVRPRLLRAVREPGALAGGLDAWMAVAAPDAVERRGAARGRPVASRGAGRGSTRTWIRFRHGSAVNMKKQHRVRGEHVFG